MIDQLNFSKLNDLVPAIVQDAETRQVLMVGFMNREAVERTLKERKAIFWSRTKQRLWQKGETSGHVLEVESVLVDCDNDALLILAKGRGPVCHTGSYTCFGEERSTSVSNAFERLEWIIRDRQKQLPEQSYTAKLFRQGTAKIAQKVGEEAVEVAIASLLQDPNALKEESADLLYHLLVLLRERGVSFSEIAATLEARMSK
jgi:phosphoribosyl-ATP pyrophosphohydrolase/phosphoribosyl-AMP cyclohydrolase